MVSATPRPAALRRLGALLIVLVGAATFLTFLPALDGQWLNWDDETNFLENPRYRGLGWAQLKWMFTATRLAVYIPLSWMTLGLNYVLGGMNPWGYHLGNLLFHTASAGLFFLVARRLLAAGFGELGPSTAIEGGAAVAALVFAIHPLRTESVAWITERRDVQCVLFYLLAVLAYLRGAQDGGLVKGRWRALSLVAFATALSSKGLTMTLPLSLLVLDIYPLGRWRTLGWRAVIKEKVPYVALAGLGAAVALWAVLQEAKWTSFAAQGPLARLAMVGYSFWFYPWKFLWPVGLSPLYELPERVILSEWRFVLPVAGVLSVSALLVLARRRWPGGVAAWAQSVIVVAPVSGIIHAGAQLANDRFSYMSGMGFALLAGAGAAWIGRQRQDGRISRWIGAVAAGAIVLALAGLGFGTWEQTKVWHDSESLWRTALEVDGSCVLCHMNLSNALLGQGRAREAEVHYRRAVALRPRFPEPYNNLGIALATQRRHAEAEAAFREAVRLSPNLVGGLANLGALYAEQGRWADAVPPIRRALLIQPDLPRLRDLATTAFRSRAVELAREGRLDEAVTLMKEIKGRSTPSEEILLLLGQSLVEQGAPAPALPALLRVVAAHPWDATARFWLARAYRLSRQPALAEREIVLLRQLDPVLAAQAAR
jgi:Flp pilus assembly protein TadD